MNILVIDGMGGGIGKAIIEHIRNSFPDAEITAVGTNSFATASMLKAGANYGATGENAVVYNCTKADYIIGVIGIILANSMHGEISPAMAESVSKSSAHKIFIPITKCSATIAGMEKMTVQESIAGISRILREDVDKR